MKKDRKKFNLHELAGQVEKMSRPEQESSAGGDYYYNEQGMFLGQRGTGSQLRVIADNDFLIGQCAGEEYLNRNGAYDFSQASMSGQMRIVSAIAGQPCEVYYNSSDYNESGHTVTTRNGSNVTSYIGINLYGTAVRSGNYWDFVITLRHEQAHYRYNELNLTNTAMAEYQATWVSYNDPDKYRCSPELLQTINGNWEYLKSLYG